MYPADISSVRIDDGFFGGYQRLIREAVIPYEWEALNDRIEGAEKSYAIYNMKVAAGLTQGRSGGLVFQDSDLYKWLEAAGHALAAQRDATLESWVDEVAGYMQKAQRDDGYLNTYFIINGLDKRFTNLKDCHELYCMGHMIEAAVAYYGATGKRVLLDVACRFADLAADTFGPGEGQMPGYPGHQEAELALVKLYRATGRERYLRLAEYFINQRGQEPNYFITEWEKRGKTGYWNARDHSRPNLSYHQAHKPVREQTEAVGHSVRAVYMYAGMMAVAAETGDKSLIAACETLFNNIAQKQMYITGGIGQTRAGEAFTFDYDLPNNTIYSETCAAIGLIFFAYEMLLAGPKGVYADVIETALYNTVLAGMSLDGTRFFYVNPLSVWPEASRKSPDIKHVDPERPKWFGCACCPPNVARLLASLGKYMYMCEGDTAYVNLYAGGTAQLKLSGVNLSLTQTTGYPWDGEIAIALTPDAPAEATVALRLPGWCRAPRVAVNGCDVPVSAAKDGYLHIRRVWAQGDVITLSLPMEARFMKANAHVRADAGMTALTRGPVVYCLEEADNGPNIPAISVFANRRPAYEFRPDMLGGIGIITADGLRDADDDTALYHEYTGGTKPARLTYIPYFAWGNRGENEMAVWVRAQNG